MVQLNTVYQLKTINEMLAQVGSADAEMVEHARKAMTFFENERNKNDLGDDEFVNSKLLEVDELFKSTNELFEKFIKERLVTDCDDDELMDSILELKVRLYENYDGVRDCMNEIKWEVGQYWDD